MKLIRFFKNLFKGGYSKELMDRQYKYLVELYFPEHAVWQSKPFWESVLENAIKGENNVTDK